MICQSSNVDIAVIMNRIENHDLNLQPDFQRGEVWSEKKKKKLIDSILRDWKIPPIHVIPNSEQIDEVLDGQQRLIAIRDFLSNEFAIDGNIQPYDSKINDLHGKKYKDLPDEVKRKFNRYSITFISLTDYKPEEPAELFDRLNQPAPLTAAEKRNAYVGDTRNQIKQLVVEFEDLGAEKDTIGFSNSRLAYDEIISKFAYMVEINSLKKKVTAGDISKRYRDDTVYSDETLSIVRNSLKEFIEVMKYYKNSNSYIPKMSKATIISWFIFISKDILNRDELVKLIALFEFSRDYFKKKIKNEQDYEIYQQVKLLQSEYPFLENILNIYNQRASMGSTDALSVIYRDVIITIFSEMILCKENTILEKVKGYYSEKKTISEILDLIREEYNWGEYLI